MNKKCKQIIESDYKQISEDFVYFQSEYNVQNIPSCSMLHHYTSSNGLMGIFKDKNIWHTNINCLNDKSEYQYTYKLIKKYILPKFKKQLKEKHLYNLMINRCSNSIDENFYKMERETFCNRNYYIACFSLAENSLPMWNYYSYNGKSLGYSVDITLSDLQENLIEQIKVKNMLMAKVCYEEDKQIEILEKIFDKYIYFYNPKNAMTNEYRLLFDNIRICSLFFKHPKYEYEEEVRNIIIERSDKKNSIIKFREKNGTIIPYIECKINLKIIKSITIAPNNEEEYMSYCVHNLARENGRFNIEIINSKIPSRY